MHLPGGVSGDALLESRDDFSALQTPREDVSPPVSQTSLIIAGVVVGVVLLIVTVILIRTIRSRQNGRKYSHPGNDDDNTDGGSRRQSRLREAQTDFESALAEEQSNLNRQNNTATVDRNTSLRSIMTLPAYRQKPSEEEHVLGREGERDGIDVVVELPTAEDEEALREDEMDALYQIRLARRRQLAEREERRQARREARLRHDIVALQEIRDQTRVAAEGAVQEIEELRGEHERQKDKRHRAVSSVSYHDVGIARHDGSRIRANSTESERVGLLSDAASIALSARSPSSLGHRRDRSASSVLSINTDQPGSPALGQARSRPNSGATTPRLSQSNTRAGSTPELIDSAEADLGDTDMPLHSPPGYDDVSLDEVTPAHSRATSPYPEPPPEYPGPTEARNKRLSAHAQDLAGAVAEEDRQSQRSQRSSGGLPQLPSLRLARLPQIVIEPSSAAPRDVSR